VRKRSSIIAALVAVGLLAGGAAASATLAVSKSPTVSHHVQRVTYGGVGVSHVLHIRYGNAVNPTLTRTFSMLRDASGNERATRRSLGVNPVSYMAAQPPAQAEVQEGIQSIWPLVGAKYQLDLTQAVEAPARGTEPVWMVPGKTGVCLVNAEGDGGSVAGAQCNSVGAASDGELWTVDSVPFGPAARATQALIGVAPDGNATVTVNWNDAAPSVIPVISNVYDVEIGAHSGFDTIAMQSVDGQPLVVPGLGKLP
jgi:hypothetical protein